MVFALSAAMLIGVCKGICVLYKTSKGELPTAPTCTNLIEYFFDTKYF
jgi:hypothetical protein